MPTYKNISNQTKYVLGRFVQPGEIIATEQIITDSDFEKVSDDPIWSPLKFSQTYNMPEGSTQSIPVPTPDRNMYIAIIKNTCGVNIYNGSSGMLVSLFPNQLTVIETHGRVETLIIEAWTDGDVAVEISTEPTVIK